MIIHLINPFEYGTNKQWDLVIEENGLQILRQTITFNSDVTDVELESFSIDYFNAQNYIDEENNPISYTEIIIDKPEHWDN